MTTGCAASPPTLTLPHKGGGNRRRAISPSPLMGEGGVGVQEAAWSPL